MSLLKKKKAASPWLPSLFQPHVMMLWHIHILVWLYRHYMRATSCVVSSLTFQTLRAELIQENGTMVPLRGCKACAQQRSEPRGFEARLHLYTRHPSKKSKGIKHLTVYNYGFLVILFILKALFDKCIIHSLAVECCESQSLSFEHMKNCVFDFFVVWVATPSYKKRQRPTSHLFNTPYWMFESIWHDLCSCVAVFPPSCVTVVPDNLAAPACLAHLK